MERQYSFKTREGAENVLSAAQNENLGFCPLINAPCRKDCICYYEGAIIESGYPSDKPWTIHYPSCNNVLILGAMDVHCEY